jgi:hypothetical protein
MDASWFDKLLQTDHFSGAFLLFSGVFAPEQQTILKP